MASPYCIACYLFQASWAYGSLTDQKDSLWIPRPSPKNSYRDLIRNSTFPYFLPSLLISILKLRHQGPKSKPVVKIFYLLKNILNQHRNYVVQYFYPKLSHSLICIKIPYSKIPNNAPSLPAKILTLLCFEVEQI